MTLIRERQSRRGSRQVLAGVAMALAIAGVAGMVAHVRATPLASARCDFNDDGFEDLALGVPGENVNGVRNAGAVNVLYGGRAGLTAVGNQLWHQDTQDVQGTAQAGDAFGATLVCGHFNLDAFADLAIGVPNEDVDGRVDAGAVNVLYGGRRGLVATGNEVWHQDMGTIAGDAERGDRFGSALAAGDFNGDGADDLAVGVPGENVTGHNNAGTVNLLYGGSGGLDDAGNRLWHQDSLLVRNTVEGDDLFGSSLAAGDFDHDGFDDLAIGVPGEDVDGNYDAGAVTVLNGSAIGLAADRNQFWSQDDLAGALEAGDNFGHALASGDFNSDGFDDLAVGVPGEDIGDESSAGLVNVIYGSRTLLTASRNAAWHQDSASVAGGAEEADAFGAALAVADFNGDGTDDLAVGIPSEDVEGVKDAGAVEVLFGGRAGLSGTGSQIVDQDTVLVEGTAETGDAFGSAVGGGDFDGDGYADLVSAAPGEKVDGILSAGAANVLYGTGGIGPAGVRDQIWHQGVAGVLGALERYDRLGSQPITSGGLYRIPFANGTLVAVTNDHFSHSPDFNEIDMHAEPNDNGEEYTIVAAAAGTIKAIDDSHAEPTDSNNYVWIAHDNGEWTKYTHVATGSVAALGLSVGDRVRAGTALGIESNVGQASGVHLHFEVAVPDDLSNPIDSGGFIIGLSRVPLICGIPGNVFYDGSAYVAAAC